MRPGVYAVTFDGKYFKVGRANNIRQRIADLQVGHPTDARLLRVLSANPDDEKDWHRRLSAFHVRGEWFLITEVSMDLIGLGDQNSG